MTANPTSKNAHFGLLYDTRRRPDYWVIAWEGITYHHGSKKVNPRLPEAN